MTQKNRTGHNPLYVVGVAATAALGGLMFGFDVAIITGAGPFIETAFHLDHLQLGLAFSSLLFGCVVGCAIAGTLADLLGRRVIMLGVALVFAATTVATGMANEFSHFLIARFLGGLAVGAVSLVAPMYVAEVAPPRLRGRLGASYQMAVVTGILASYFINYALRNTGPDAWRYMFYTGVVPSVLFFLLMLMSPETPRYLVLKGLHDKARAVLARIAGAGADEELESIERDIAEGKADKTPASKSGLGRALIVSFFLAILIHLSGINTIIDYAPSIFKSAGFHLDAALLSTFVVGIAIFAFTIVSFFTIDRFGRRPLYVWGSLGMAVALLVMVGAVLTGHFSGMFVLIFIVIYIMFFSACIGPVFWTLLPEIFPNAGRGKALIVPVLTQWVANAVVVLFFPVVFNKLGQAGTFGLLGAACIAQALFFHFFVPETRNRSLEEIAHAWKGPVK